METDWKYSPDGRAVRKGWRESDVMMVIRSGTQIVGLEDGLELRVGVWIVGSGIFFRTGNYGSDGSGTTDTRCGPDGSDPDGSGVG